MKTIRRNKRALRIILSKKRERRLAYNAAVRGKPFYGDYFYQRGEPLTPLGKMAIYYPDGILNPFFRSKFFI